MEVREFSALVNYAKDDLTMYGGKLYRFTSAHNAGAWTGSDVEEVDHSKEADITRILSGMDNAEKATAYAGTVKFIPAIVAGTRNKYILTDAPDPRE